MKDALEDFVRNNRSAFDVREPRKRIWASIERTLFGAGGPWWNSLVLWRAAAVIFMALSVYLSLPGFQSGEKHRLALKEFNDVEAFYFQQISQKVDLIDDFQQNDGLNGFTHDFQQLEAMYLVLKDEMKTRPSQKVRDALILNLLVRIDLLNQQLHKLEVGNGRQSIING